MTQQQNGPSNRKSDWVLARLIIALLVIVCVAVTVGFIALNRAEHTERLDRDTNRSTAFRLCSRNKADRAYAHTRERGLAIAGIPEVPMSARERERRRDLSRILMQTPLLAILDCEPNLKGHGARPLPLAEQEKYMDAWRRQQLSPEEYGVCPNTLLEGDPTAPGRC